MILGIYKTNAYVIFSVVPYRGTWSVADINFAAFANRYVPVLVDLSDSILIIAVLKLLFHSLFRLGN